MLTLLMRWMVLTVTLFAGAISLIRARPYDDRGLAAMLRVPPGCAAPCWQGIRPRVTTGPTALALLGQVDVLHDLDSQFDTAAGQIFWHWRDNDPDLLIQDKRWSWVWLEDNVVSNIFLPDFRHFADIYLLLGRPEKVMLFSDSLFALGPVVYLSIYPDEVYVASFIHCRADVTDLWRAPSNIHIGKRPVYEGAIEREFDPSDLRGWLPDRLCSYA